MDLIRKHKASQIKVELPFESFFYNVLAEIELGAQECRFEGGESLDEERECPACEWDHKRDVWAAVDC